MLTHSLSLILLYKVDSQRKRETAEVGEQGRERGEVKEKGGDKKDERGEMSDGEKKNRLKLVNLHALSSETLIAPYLPLRKPCSFIIHAQIALNYT